MQSKVKSRILGIDPGFGRMGVAIIENERILHSECFETSKNLPHPKRLKLISEKIEELLKKWEPHILSLETLLFSKNVKTAMQVAEARGVILVEAAKAKVKVLELNPNEVKLAVTGYGKSDKKQIIKMIEMIYKIKTKIKFDDEYDAIAVATAAKFKKNLSYPQKSL